MVTQVVDDGGHRTVKWVALSRRTLFSLEHGGNLMVNKLMAPAKWALALALVLPTTGCLAAAAAAGAGAGIYLTSRGAESMVASSVDQVASRARQVMNEEGIVPDASSMEKGGDKREFKGKKGDLDITIDMERKDAKTTRVEVTARKNLAEWDKDYAQQLLSKIVAKS
jgi:uncharacterized protein DUF3568